ncbi:hypothetical protein ACHAXA_007743 [Cyclostephanos tholiformis]|uniref:Myb-like domain-containing protein n=1 Tax=Cyclostephanos tholiformis TaxID=382380 RepID=A0ABD3RAC6_9STRA
MAQVDDGNDLGFMGTVLGRAKKVLFPETEVDTSPPRGDGDGGEGTRSALALASSSTTTSIGIPMEGRMNSKTRARRARLIRLMASNSSLANFAVASSGRAMSERPSVVGADGNGKENRKPKTHVAKRGNSMKMDAFAAASSDFTMTHSDKDDVVVAAKERRTKFTIDGRVNDVDDRRRSSHRSKDTSLHFCGELSVDGGIAGEGNNQRPSEFKQPVVRPGSSVDETTTYSIAEIDAMLLNGGRKITPGNHRGQRRRNRPAVSSLVQYEEMGECKRNSGVPSSLMTLTSSIQKTQKSRRSRRDNWKAKQLATAFHSSGQTSIPSRGRDNVASLANSVESLKIGDTADCSTPLTIRRRAMPGGITSPPGNLHRFSTLSNANVFDHSPMPDSNPNLKKRFDGKKTPIGKVNVPAASLPPATSPLAMMTKMSTSPYNFTDASMMKFGYAKGTEDKEASSPRVTVTSSSYISSPNNECNALSHARSILFSSSDDSRKSNVPRRGLAVTMEVATPRVKAHNVKVRTTSSASPRGPVRGSSVFDVEVVIPVVKNESDAFSEPQQMGLTKAAANKDKSKKMAANRKVSVCPRVTTKVVEDDNSTQVRRSSRQSKPTDRLTVTSWINKDDSNTDERLRFENSADVEGITCAIIEEAVSHTQKVGGSMEQADATEEVEGSDDASKPNSSEGSTSNHNTVQKNTAGVVSEQEWSYEDLQILHHCQKEINPTSTLYWQEVSNRVGTKTSSECQIKWQSLVPTPKVRKASKMKNANQSARIPHHDSKGGAVDDSITDDDDDDDYFDSSPYRETNLKDGKETNAAMFTGVGTSIGFTPCIKQSAKSNQSSELKFRRKGYNTYIDNLRKDIIRAEKKKIALKTSQALDDRAQISVGIDVEGGRMSGNLLPDGTVKINIPDESSDSDDIWDDHDEDED